MENRDVIRAIFGALPLFEAAARLRSFTGASREFGLTQPAVSRRIIEMERILGARLFLRQNNTLTLTAKGKTLFQAMTSGYDPMVSAIQDISATRQKKTLRIACGFSFASMWLQPRFELLRECLKSQEIQLVATETLDELDPNDIDMRILWRPDAWPGRTLVPILPEDICLVCSPGFAIANGIDTGHDLSFEQLQTLPLISYDHGAEEYCDWPSWFSRLSDQAPLTSPGYTYSSFMYAIQAALMGKGIAIGFMPMIAEYIENGDLQCIGDVLHYRDEALFFEYVPDALSPAITTKLLNWFNDQRTDTEKTYTRP